MFNADLKGLWKWFCSGTKVASFFLICTCTVVSLLWGSNPLFAWTSQENSVPLEGGIAPSRDGAARGLNICTIGSSVVIDVVSDSDGIDAETLIRDAESLVQRRGGLVSKDLQMGLARARGGKSG